MMWDDVGILAGCGRLARLMQCASLVPIISTAGNSSRDDTGDSTRDHAAIPGR